MARGKSDFMAKSYYISGIARFVVFSAILVSLVACDNDTKISETSSSSISSNYTSMKNSEISTDAHKAFLGSISYEQALQDVDDYLRVERSDEEWRKILTSSEYRILRNKGTEFPYRNEYDGFYEDGVYVCRGCGNTLFHSDTKYNSRSGWPSFWAPIREGAVGEKEDNSFFMRRVETVCARCDSHLGHVFTDGPDPTGLRYCMNSLALYFIPKSK